MHVAAMQKIETAVGENHGLAGSARFRGDGFELAEVLELAGHAFLGSMIRCCFQLQFVLRLGPPKSLTGR